MARDHRVGTAVRKCCDIRQVRPVVPPVHHRHIDGLIGGDRRRGDYILLQRRSNSGYIRSQRIKEHRHRTKRWHHVTDSRYRALPDGRGKCDGARTDIDIDTWRRQGFSAYFTDNGGISRFDHSRAWNHHAALNR